MKETSVCGGNNLRGHHQSIQLLQLPAAPVLVRPRARRGAQRPHESRHAVRQKLPTDRFDPHVHSRPEQSIKAEGQL